MLNKRRIKSILVRYLGTEFLSMISNFRKSNNIDEIKIIAKVFKRSSAHHGVMFDVGCHFGESSKIFLAMGWDVHAFEPDCTKIPELKKIRNPNFKINNIAITELTQTSLNFYTSEESTGISSLLTFHHTHQHSDIVDGISISDYCAANNIKNIDFLKIDIEGFDFFALRGVAWDTMLPEVIICEYEDKKTEQLGHDSKTIVNFLVHKGYRVAISEWYPIVQYGQKHKWKTLHLDEFLRPSPHLQLLL